VGQWPAVGEYQQTKMSKYLGRSDSAALKIDLRLPNYWIGSTEGRLAFIARYGRITGDPQCILRVVGLPAVQSEAVMSCG
jgi:hypothetical protein